MMASHLDWFKIAKPKRGSSLISLLACFTVCSLLLLYNQKFIKHRLHMDYLEPPDLQWVRQYRHSSNHVDNDQKDCTSLLERYERRVSGATYNVGWMFCEDIFEILSQCVKSAELYAKPLPNFYLRQKDSEVEDKSYAEASVAFVHLPKSGGTSVEEFLLPLIAKSSFFAETQVVVPHCHEFSDAALLLSKSTSRMLFYSKRTYGLHNFAPKDRPFFYFAWFRNPVDRIVSAYYYIRKTRPRFHVMYERYVGMDIDNNIAPNLTAFLINTKDVRITEFDNLFVRLLQFGAYPSIDGAFEDCCGSDYRSKNVPEIKEEHYLVAKQNIENNLAFIGIMEEFKLSQDMLSYALGKPPEKAEVRVNTNPHKTIITEFERKEIEKRNYWDLKLFEDAKKIFEKQKRKYYEIYNLKDEALDTKVTVRT